MIYQTLLLALAGAALSTPTTPLATGLQQKHQALSPRQNRGSFRGTSQNGLQGGDCAENMIIFARGTTEAGNVGSVAGPPFFQAMAAQLGAGNLLVQGVEYPADIPGFLAGGDADGSQLMADLTTQAVADCPGSKVIMSGYSQGAQLVHNAAELMDGAAVSQVAGTVLFGDPNNGQSVTGVAADKQKVFCNNGDNICDGGNLILLPHLTYGQDADEAADFAVGL